MSSGHGLCRVNAAFGANRDVPSAKEVAIAKGCARILRNRHGYGGACNLAWRRDFARRPKQAHAHAGAAGNSGKKVVWLRDASGSAGVVIPGT